MDYNCIIFQLKIILTKNGKNPKIKLVGFSIQNKKIAFCSELPFGILSSNSYLDFGSMNVICSSIEI